MWPNDGAQECKWGLSFYYRQMLPLELYSLVAWGGRGKGGEERPLNLKVIIGLVYQLCDLDRSQPL